MDAMADKQTGRHFEDQLRITRIRIIHGGVVSIAKGWRRLPAKEAFSFVGAAASAHRQTSGTMWTSLAICLLTCLLPVSVPAQQSTGKTQDNSNVLVARTERVERARTDAYGARPTRRKDLITIVERRAGSRSDAYATCDARQGKPNRDMSPIPR